MVELGVVYEDLLIVDPRLDAADCDDDSVNTLQGVVVAEELIERIDGDTDGLAVSVCVLTWDIEIVPVEDAYNVDDIVPLIVNERVVDRVFEEDSVEEWLDEPELLVNPLLLDRTERV